MAGGRIVVASMPSINLLETMASSSYFEMKEHEAYYRALKHAGARRDFHEKLIPICTRFIELTSKRENEVLIDALLAWSTKKRSDSRSDESVAVQARERHPHGYQLLGLCEPLTFESLQKAYRAAALKHHPDRGGSHEAMVTINEAYTGIHGLLLQQQFLSQGIPMPMENPHAGAVRILKCQDYRYLIGHLLLSVYLDDWAIDEAFRWLQFITSDIQQKSAYASIVFLQVGLVEMAAKLATRLTFAGMKDQARFCLKIAQKNLHEVKSEGIEKSRIRLNHPRQAENALRLGIIDRKEYKRVITKLEVVNEQRRDRDAAQEVDLVRYSANSGFLIDLPPDRIAVGKTTQARLVPEPFYFMTRVAHLTNDQQAEYAATFGPQAPLKMVRKYTFVRLQSLLETAILHPWEARLAELERECLLLADLTAGVVAWPHGDSARYYALGVAETIRFLADIDAQERKARLTILRALNGDDAVYRMGLSLYKVGLGSEYFALVRGPLQKLQKLLKTRRFDQERSERHRALHS